MLSSPKRVLFIIGLLALATPNMLFSQIVTDPSKGGLDFELQGEYAGRIQAGGIDELWGAQVVALGEGKFDLVGFKGGLPGDGWKRGDEIRSYQGELVDGGAFFKGEMADFRVRDGKLDILVDGQTIASLEKKERRSPTLGMAPTQGAVVLFRGENVDAWENGKLVEDQYLGATNVSSKLKLGDHHLHIEFRTPFMPKERGQARGNSGVYVQGRYEVQILDSFGLDGKENECGGIYSIQKPVVNMCFPPLTWQTYDIDFTAARYEGTVKKTNARVTVRHNGVVIHDNLELPNGTPGYKPEGSDKESLFLQDHGNPVVFRNIWVVEK